jgi:dolichol kinase
MSYAIFGHENYTGHNIIWTAPISVQGILSDKAAIYYFLPLLIFTISDPLAALVGQQWPKGKYTFLKESKTIAGSSAFFVSSFGITYLFFGVQMSTTATAVAMSVIMALVTTIVEGLSQKGFDNLLVPVSSVFVLIILSQLL